MSVNQQLVLRIAVAVYVIFKLLHSRWVHHNFQNRFFIVSLDGLINFKREFGVELFSLINLDHIRDVKFKACSDKVKIIKAHHLTLTIRLIFDLKANASLWEQPQKVEVWLLFDHAAHVRGPMFLAVLKFVVFVIASRLIELPVHEIWVRFNVQVEL